MQAANRALDLGYQKPTEEAIRNRGHICVIMKEVVSWFCLVSRERVPVKASCNQSLLCRWGV